MTHSRSPNFPAKNLRVLLCNDDGIHASGLKILKKIASTISRDIWTVAPEAEQSGASHSLTIRHPLSIRKLSPKRYAVNGTPTDCIMAALRHIMKNKRPHLVLSGVNHGSNLAEDITYSGTVAAAMEATLLGIPAIAMSLAVNSGHPAKWATPEHFGPSIIQHLLHFDWPSNVFMNINFPDLVVKSVMGTKITTQGQRPISDGLVESRDPRGRVYYWIGSEELEAETSPHSDLAAIKKGYLSITPIYMDLTHRPTLQTLGQHFDHFTPHR